MAFSRGLDITKRELVRCLDPGNPKSYPGSGNDKMVNLISRAEATISGTGNWEYDAADSKGSLILVQNSIIYDASVTSASYTTRSIQFWIKRTSTFSAPFGTFGYPFGGNCSYSSIDNRISISKLTGSTTVYKEFNIGIDYPLNQWINICWIFENAVDFGPNDVKIYVNGVYYPITQTVVNNSILTFPLNLLSLNTYYTVNQANIDAKYGHILEYNTALTEEEVIRNYNATKHRYT